MNEITIFQTFNPGSITRIDGTDTWFADGSRPTGVQWELLWSDPEGQPNDRLLKESIAFSPNLCPVVTPSRYVRVTVDTRLNPISREEIDAIEFRGSIDFPQGLIATSGTSNPRILYVPKQGVHAAGLLDRFTYTASDCLAESESEAVVGLIVNWDGDRTMWLENGNGGLQTSTNGAGLLNSAQVEACIAAPEIMATSATFSGGNIGEGLDFEDLRGDFVLAI